MNVQSLLVFALFTIAIWYVGRMVYRSLKPKNEGCGGGCKCGIDFSDVLSDKK